jgi:RHS repeat-associated protein
VLLVTAASAQFLLSPSSAVAKDVGADPASKCRACPRCKCPDPSTQEPSQTTSSVSRTEGNLVERVDIAHTSGFMSDPTSFVATYNSYNADTSRVQLDTVMGYGWTHSHNIFLFSQVGSMFRFDGDGRVTRYKLGAGGTFSAAPGYFETLVKNPDGSFTLTQKDRTTYTFRLIAGTPFFLVGPVYRVTSIVDRNGNTTTYTYSGGNLTSVTDTYGRSVTFTYATFSSSNKKLTSVTDPAGKVTAFQYDTTGRKLTKITDPNGKTIQYSYNTLYQLTAKQDKDGRTFTYSYSSFEPTSVNDGSGATSGALSNPGNWATDTTQLAANQSRVYIPATTTKVDGRGNTWLYDYDTNGHITRITAPDATVTQYTYSPSTLLVTSTTDPRGNVTTYNYDALGNQTSSTDALGHVTTYTYEPTFNQMTSMTDPRGRTTTYTIDPLTGNRLQESDPNGGTRTYTYDSHGNVLTDTDKDGHTTRYTYGAAGDVIQILDPLGHATQMTYDPVGNLLSRTDALGHATQMQHDGMNRVIQVTDALSDVTVTQFDGEGNRTAITDRNGHTTTMQYDLRQRLIKITDALGHFNSDTYDGNDNRTSQTDRNGHTTSYQYDVQNRLQQTTDPLGNVASTVYDPAGNATSETDANGHTTNNTYDALNRRITTTDALGNVTQTIYDTGTVAGCPNCGVTPGSDLTTGRIDANGKATYFKYDALDRLIDTVKKVGSTADTITAADALTTTTYDPQGNRLSETIRCTPCSTDPTGNATVFVYDADNRRIQMTNAAGDVTRYTFDGVDDVITITEPNGNIIGNTYDSLNRVIQTTDSAGPVASYGYDPEGNRTSITDGNGNTTASTYDAVNRVVSTTDPLGKVTTTAYDFVGNVVQSVDRNGHATTYAYDADNRRITTTDALGGVTSYQYDPVGNRTQITDANGHATQYQYDAVNRMTRETYANGTALTLQYDPVGNVTRRTDQIGQVTTYAYDDLYDLTSRSYPSLVNDSFTYDLAQRMLSAQRGAWPDAFVYDGADRTLQAVQNGRVVTYSYNIPGRTRTVTYPSGRTIVEHTDARTRIAAIDDAVPNLVQYTYDPGNRVLNRAYRNGTSAFYTYNANNWLTSLQHTGPSPIAGFTYAYDNEGNRSFEGKTLDPLNSEKYQYDARDRLIDFKVGDLSGVPPPSTQTAYTLDPVGNWTSKTTNGATQNRTHDVVNELTQIDATPITYDANGNPQVDGTLTYAFDEENRLTMATRTFDGAIWQYQYDALGRRVAKAPLPSAPSSTTLYFYDGARIVEEQNGAAATQATYVYGNYVDEVLTMDRTGSTYYYHQNALWSVAAITNSAAAVVERYSYDAYGAPAITNGSGVPVPLNAWGTPHSAIGNPYMFTGRQLDEETGLFFYRARYYDTNKGRYVQRDPAGYVDGLNLYEYSRSNPVRYFDPTGFVTGSFSGGVTREATGISPGIRATTFISRTLNCTCSRCVVPATAREEKKTCWFIACEFNVRAPIRIRPDADDVWKDAGWDRVYGNTTGTLASRVANVLSHEEDHQKTTKAFYDYNKAKLEGEEAICHDSQKKCNDRKELVADRVNVNWGVQSRHSDDFDNIEALQKGNQYATHPLTGQTWPD